MPDIDIVLEATYLGGEKVGPFDPYSPIHSGHFSAQMKNAAQSAGGKLETAATAEKPQPSHSRLCGR